MLATPGAKAELYGWEDVLYKPEEIVICEGEFDRLALKAQGFRTVTSTGGARTFRAEWADEFGAIPDVYICFDRDAAGREGALHVGRMIPHAKIVELPEEVGEGGDVTDFFVRLGRSDDDFWELFKTAQPSPPATPEIVSEPERASRRAIIEQSKIAGLKQALPIVDGPFPPNHGVSTKTVMGKDPPSRDESRVSSVLRRGPDNVEPEWYEESDDGDQSTDASS